MPARAFLAVVRADEHAHRPTPDDVIPFVLQRDLPLFIALVVRPARDTAHPLAWPDWRGRPPGTITHQSPPEANRIPHTKITNYGWSGQMAAALMSNGWGALCESDNSTIRDPLLREYPIRWPLGGRTPLDGAA
ncbi:hypothetical protein [Streptomyces achromogenes]|nr:hypothetical protein [Streptomyces achromogenes]